MTPYVIRLFQTMADLTAPECATSCTLPHSCCSPEYCDMAAEVAAEHDMVLTRTEHPTLPYMGPQGCTVPPHYRPLCTLHTCAINSHGFKPGDPKWTAKYFETRGKIEAAFDEWQL